jgi:hypothetical protein
MKKIVVLFVFLFFALPQTSLAAETGLPSFIKINGEFSSVHFLLSQNLKPKHYVVNKPISFAIDEKQLAIVIPKEFLTRTKYDWNFGDGTRGEGKQQVHEYKKAESYIAVLTTTVSIDGFATPTQYTESFLITIVPKKYDDRLSKKSLWIVQNALLSK